MTKTVKKYSEATIHLPGENDESSWTPSTQNANGYPQFGQYLDYTTISKKSMTHKNEYTPITETTGVKYVSGVIGPKGVLIQAQYHGEVGFEGVAGANLRQSWICSHEPRHQ